VQRGEAKYIVWQHEICPLTKKEHLQGYIEWHAPQRKSRLTTLVGADFKPHIETRHGTALQAAEYCKKEDSRKPGTTFIEFGQISVGQGSRSDLNAIQVSMQSGVKSSTIAHTNFASWTKYHKAFDKYQEILVKQRERCTVSIVLWGESDSGKTRTARSCFPDAYWISAGNGGVWWDIYEQQNAVVFDEFTGWIKFMDFKRLIDASPYTSDAKGAQKTFTSRFSVFTSNAPPTEWYDRDKSVDVAAFARRIHLELEAKKLVSLRGEEKVVCNLRKCVLPWNAAMPDGWKLPGLTSKESFQLINPEVHEAERRRIAQKCPIVTMGQSHKVGQSGGVILYPPLDREMDFATAARSVIHCVLLGREAPAAGSVGVAAGFDAALRRENSLEIEIPGAEVSLQRTHSASPIKTIMETSDDEETRLDALGKKFGGKPPHPLERSNANFSQYVVGKDYCGCSLNTPCECGYYSIGGAAVPARHLPVRHDQVYRKPHFKTNYPGFGVDAVEHPHRSKDGQHTAPLDAGSDNDGSAEFPRTMRVKYDRERDRGEDIGADDESRSSAGSYEEDSFVEDDMHVPSPPPRRAGRKLGYRYRPQ